jgi:hypothetical protein
MPPASLTRVVKLVAGRLPDQSAPGEVLASFTLAQDKGMHVGSVIRVPMYARSQQAALSTGGQPVPRGPRLALRVVGIEAAENEFPSGLISVHLDGGATAVAASIRPQAVGWWVLARLAHWRGWR